jgi:ABC-type Mn2+/Zn2+ transport system permease subunit
MTLDALLGGAGVVVMCGVLSPLVVVKRLGFVGQGVSHAAFGGIGIATVLAALGLLAAGGAGEFAVIVVFCIAAALAIAGVSNRRTLPEDTTIGIVLVGSMALGALLVQAGPSIARARGASFAPRSWESILFGSVLNISRAEALVGVGLALAVVGVVWLVRRPMLFYAFDEDSARAFGVPTRWMRAVLMILLALAVVTAMKLAGVVLATALLVLPGAIALRLTTRLRRALAFSVGSGLLALVIGLCGAIELDWQAGPSVVLVLCVFFGAAWGVGRLRRGFTAGSSPARAGPTNMVP